LVSNLKKRRFRQLERHDIFENINDELDEGFEPEFKQLTTKRSIKLNEKILKKASATIDLISQKVKSQNVIQETVSASFVTNVIELTHDALK
jgi:hypothetical protein